MFGLLGPSVCVNAPIAEVISMHGWVVPRNTFTVEGEAHLESFEGNSAVVAHKDEGVLPDLLDEGFIRKFDILQHACNASNAAELQYLAHHYGGIGGGIPLVED